MSFSTEMSVLHRPTEHQPTIQPHLHTQDKGFTEAEYVPVSHHVPTRPVTQFKRALPPPEPQLLKDLRGLHTRLQEAIQSGDYEQESAVERDIEECGVLLFDTIPSEHSEYFLTLPDVDQEMIFEFGNLQTPEWVILFCSLPNTARSRLYTLGQKVHRLENQAQKIVRYYRVFPQCELAQLAVFTALPTKDRLLIEKGRKVSSQHKDCQIWYAKLGKDHKRFASDFACAGTNVQAIAKEYRELSSADKKYVCSYALMARCDKNFICKYTSLSLEQIGYLKAFHQLHSDDASEVLHDLNPKVRQVRSEYRNCPYYHDAISGIKDDIQRLRYPDVFDGFFVLEDVDEDVNGASPELQDHLTDFQQLAFLKA